MVPVGGPHPQNCPGSPGRGGGFKSVLLTGTERPSFHFCKRKGLPISPRRPKSGATKPGKVIMRVKPIEKTPHLELAELGSGGHGGRSRGDYGVQ